MPSRIDLPATLCAAALLAFAAFAFGRSAEAQVQPGEQIVGYAVDAHTQFVLLRQSDGLTARLQDQSRNRIAP